MTALAVSAPAIELLAGHAILGVRVDATSIEDASVRVLDWARRRESRAVLHANVHMVMEARDQPGFRAVVNMADLVTPDGVPLVWVLRRLGFPGQGRVYGPDLMVELCRRAAATGVPVGFFGGAPDVLAALLVNLRRRFPGLAVAFAESPPFRPLSVEEDAAIAERVHASGTRILFVGLGCPKQERWIAGQRGRLPAVMLGAGAAFDFHAGMVRQAPRWLQTAGLEWAFRLAMEPRRLWRRYARHNPRFTVLMLLELAGMRGSRRDAR